ncbi:unnamed protein product, partial [Meganyctiphanes norvegica]
SSSTSFSYTIPYSHYSNIDEKRPNSGTPGIPQRRPASAIGHDAFQYALNRPRKKAVLSASRPREPPVSNFRNYKVKQLKSSTPAGTGHEGYASSTTKHRGGDSDEDDDEQRPDEQRRRGETPPHYTEQGHHHAAKQTTKELRNYRYFHKT